MFAVRFQHGSLSRGGRRRNSPPGNARAEGFTVDTRAYRRTPNERERPKQDFIRPPEGGFLLASPSVLTRDPPASAPRESAQEFNSRPLPL